MKMRVLIDCTMLDAWKRNPRGYVVLKVTLTVKIESVATGKSIIFVRVSSNVDRALRQLDKIREVFDIEPNGMRPRIVAVPFAITEDPRSEQFMKRAAMIVEF